MIQAYKDAFDRAGSPYLHFNNAGVAPWPKSTEAAVREWSSVIANQGSNFERDPFLKSDETRALIAQTLGTSQEQVAFFQTCASAISQVALGLPLEKGSEIITWDQEYPSNFYPWKLAADACGGKLIVAPSEASLATPVETLISLVTPKTRVIAVSWVQYRTGALTDLVRLSTFARERGIFTCVDIIQGAGVLPFDFDCLGLDAACGGAHKWFTSPLSLGFLLLRPEHITKLKPLSVGAMTYGGFDKLSDVATPMVETIQRFEPGGRCLLETIAFGETLRLMQSVGIEAIGREAIANANRLAAGLRKQGYLIHAPDLDGQLRTPILNFSPTANAPAKTIELVCERLSKARASFAVRPPGVRLSPHGFTRAEEIERVLEVLS